MSEYQQFDREQQEDSRFQILKVKSCYLGFQITVRCNPGDTDQKVENDKWVQAACLYLIVALHSVDKSLISHDLCVSVKKGLETILGLLELLLGNLRDEKINILKCKH